MLKEIDLMLSADDPFACSHEMVEKQHEEGISRAIRYAKNHFETEGKYRAIKFAARADTIPVLPDELGSQRGLFCSMFVIAAYQASALKNHVTPIGHDRSHWVSDKHADLSDLKNLNQFSVFNIFKYRQRQKDLAHYKAYCEQLQKNDPNKEKQRAHKVYPPGISAWNFDRNGNIDTFDFSRAMSEGMLLDCKVTMPNTLMHSLDRDHASWERGPELLIQKLEHSEASKKSTVN